MYSAGRGGSNRSTGRLQDFMIFDVTIKVINSLKGQELQETDCFCKSHPGFRAELRWKMPPKASSSLGIHPHDARRGEK